MKYRVAANMQEALMLAQTDTVRAVVQNVRILLTTRKGTCPHYREFGLSQAWVDKPINVARSMLYTEIKEALQDFEPRAELVSVSFSDDASAPGRLAPIVEVEISDE